MRALVLDFDGVISNSAREAYAIATRTYRDLEPDTALRFDDPELFDRFVEVMPLGNRAEDFGVALSAVAKGVEIGDQASYDAFYSRHDAGWRHAFRTLA